MNNHPTSHNYARQYVPAAGVDTTAGVVTDTGVVAAAGVAAAAAVAVAAAVIIAAGAIPSHQLIHISCCAPCFAPCCHEGFVL